MNRDETLGLMARTAALWPAWRVPQSTAELRPVVDAWAEMLEAVPAAAALAAVQRASLDGRDWPPPVGWVVVEALRLAGAPLPPTADEAWGEVQEALAGVGRYGVPSWSHPAVGDTVRALGGWRALCDGTAGSVDRAHFLRLYEPAARRLLLDVAAPPALARTLRVLESDAPTKLLDRR